MSDYSLELIGKIISINEQHLSMLDKLKLICGELFNYFNLSGLIYYSYKDFLKKECEFLEQSAKWAKRVFFFPKTLKSQIVCDNTLFYEDISEIVALQRKDFNFALVFADKKEVFETIHKENTKGLKSLF